MPRARVAIVHNGIIENFRELRDELIAQGPQIRIPDRQRSRRPSGHRQSGSAAWRPKTPPRRRCARLTGAYSIAMIFKDHEGLLIGARKGAPLAVGYAETGSLSGLGRFRAGALHQPRRLSGRWRCRGDRRARRSAIFDAEGRPANREIKITTASAALVDKAGHSHFMAKEIHEQPEVVGPHAGALSRSRRAGGAPPGQGPARGAGQGARA